MHLLGIHQWEGVLEVDTVDGVEVQARLKT